MQPLQHARQTLHLFTNEIQTSTSVRSLHPPTVHGDTGGKTCRHVDEPGSTTQSRSVTHHQGSSPERLPARSREPPNCPPSFSAEIPRHIVNSKMTYSVIFGPQLQIKLICCNPKKHCCSGKLRLLTNPGRLSQNHCEREIMPLALGKPPYITKKPYDYTFHYAHGRRAARHHPLDLYATRPRPQFCRGWTQWSGCFRRADSVLDEYDSCGWFCCHPLTGQRCCRRSKQSRGLERQHKFMESDLAR